MNYILLCFVIIGCAIQSILTKNYTIKMGNSGAYVFSAVSVLTASIFYLASAKGQFHFTMDVILYAITFGLSYSVATLFYVFAIQTGPLSLNSLIMSYSLLLPTAYGLLVWHETFSWIQGIGVILMIASLFFINYQKEQGQRKITGKWCLYLLLAFAGNGLCTIVQRE